MRLTVCSADVRLTIGDGDLRALARAQKAHGAAVADRIGGGVEDALAAADDQDAASLQASPARRFARRFRARRTDVTLRLGCRRFGHLSALRFLPPS